MQKAQFITVRDHRGRHALDLSAIMMVEEVADQFGQRGTIRVSFSGGASEEYSGQAAAEIRAAVEARVVPTPPQSPPEPAAERKRITDEVQGPTSAFDRELLRSRYTSPDPPESVALLRGLGCRSVQVGSDRYLFFANGAVKQADVRALSRTREGKIFVLTGVPSRELTFRPIGEQPPAPERVEPLSETLA